MPLLDIDLNPSPRQLRQFGLLCALVLPAVAWVWNADAAATGAVAAAGAILATVGAAFPRALRPLFVALVLIAAPIGIFVGETILLLIFFGLFFPLGLAFRLLRRDALQRSLNPTADTYWQTRPPAPNPTSYFRQS
jgi:hypothetical protein